MKPTAGAAHAAHQSSNKTKSSPSAQPTDKSAQPIYAGLRGQVQAIITTRWFQTFITTAIVLNAVTLGLDTIKVVTGAVDGNVGRVIGWLDVLFLSVFIVEILLRLFVQRLQYFRDGWNWFDLLVVGIAVMPTTDGLSALRTLRIMRALRLLSMIPSMRSVVSGLVHALPGMFSAMILLALIHYVFAVIGVHMFGGTVYGGYADGYDYFRDLGRATYTLFQIMTLESWSHGIVRPIMDVHPGPATTIYFVTYVILSAFAALNLFIGIIVNAMDTLKHEEEMGQSADEMADPAQQAILAELRALREEVAALRKD